MTAHADHDHRGHGTAPGAGAMPAHHDRHGVIGRDVPRPVLAEPALTIPVVVWSTDPGWLGYTAPAFPGSD